MQMRLAWRHSSVWREPLRLPLLKCIRASAVCLLILFSGSDAVVFCRQESPKKHKHKKVIRDDLQLPNDCVIHSFRHTFLTRFGEAGADAFTIKKVAGHSSVTISERYIHPTPEGQERAFGRFANLNQEAVEKAESDRESLQIPLHSANDRS